MKILIVSKVPTHPLTAGNRAFIYNNVELLKSMGNEIHFLFVCQISLHNKTGGRLSSMASLKDYWGDKLYVYRQNVWQKICSVVIQRYRWYLCSGYFKCDDEYPFLLHRAINKLDQNHHFDACIVNYYYLSKAFKYVTIPLKGVFTHDYFSYKSILVRDNYVASNTTAHQEAIALQRCPHIFALNSGEAEYFRRLSPKSEVYNIYNYYEYHPQPIQNNHSLLFLSGSNHYNVEGIMWFVKDVLPLIVQSFPDVRLIIGGSICTYVEGFSNNAHIEFVGFVDDVEKFYLRGDVAINPTIHGTGLKIKTFEAVSHDKITLAHPHSLDGIFDRENAPIFASGRPEDWVNILEKVWSDKNEIVRWKCSNKLYIKAMQDHIRREYRRFLDNEDTGIKQLFY